MLGNLIAHTSVVSVETPEEDDLQDINVFM
jgi:hypothetical protein